MSGGSGAVGDPDDLGDKWGYGDEEEEDEAGEEIESMARGGIAMKPQIARVGERGPEAIMKLGPRMPGAWEAPMRPGKLPYQAMRYKRHSED